MARWIVSKLGTATLCSECERNSIIINVIVTVLTQYVFIAFSTTTTTTITIIIVIIISCVSFFFVFFG